MGKRKESKVRRHFALLEYLRNIPRNKQQKIIKASGRDVLEALSEICLNLIKKNIKLTPAQINKLRPYEKQIYNLSLKRHSVAKKRDIVQKGGFLPTLLAAVLPAILSTVFAAK